MGDGRRQQDDGGDDYRREMREIKTVTLPPCVGKTVMSNFSVVLFSMADSFQLWWKLLRAAVEAR